MVFEEKKCKHVRTQSGLYNNYLFVPYPTLFKHLNLCMWGANPPVCFYLNCVFLKLAKGLATITFIDTVSYHHYCIIVKENKYSILFYFHCIDLWLKPTV